MWGKLKEWGAKLLPGKEKLNQAASAVKSNGAPLLVFALGLSLGAFGMYAWGPKQTNTQTVQMHTVEKPTIVQGELKTLTQTQLVYVPKETVTTIYKDAVTGQQTATTALEKTDLDVKVAKPEFTVSLNGQQQVFTRADDEQHLFDKNKIAMTQTSQINFVGKVDPIVIDKTKNGGLDIIVGKYSGIGISNNRVGVDITKNIFSTDKQDILVQGRWKAIQW